MRLSEAAVLCEGNNRAFAEVYKIYNFKDDDDLRAYCDFVIHEPAEWMQGFPAVWKSATMFSKPRAAFHRLLRQSSVIGELGEAYCTQVHNIVWNAFKNHMNSILEKRSGAILDNDDKQSQSAKSEVTHLTAESVDAATDDESLPPVPPVPANARRRTTPTNILVYDDPPPNYKHKFEVINNVLQILLSSEHTGDENTRLRTALAKLIQEYERV